MLAKKTSALLLCLVLILSLTAILTAGCTSETTPTTSAPATTTEPPTSTAPGTTPVSTEAPKTFTIKLIPATTGPPPQKGLTLVAEEWARIIEEATNGRIKTDIYYSESLAKGNDIVAAIETGLADAAFLRSHAEPGKIPLCTVGEMPGVSLDLWALSQAYSDLMHSDLMAAEFASHNMVPFSATLINETSIISAKRVTTIEELTKLKIGAQGINANLLSKLGATPLSISPPEQYEALYRGTVDALSAPIDAIHGFKYYEAGKYWLDIALGTRMHPVVFNKDTWESFGPELQQILTDLIPELNTSSYEAIKATGDEGFDALRAAGVEFISLSEEDLAKMNEAYKAIHEEWVAEQEAAGRQGQPLMDKYLELAEHYKSISPYK